MRKLIIGLAALGLATQAQAVNLISNGDFELGNSGFTSGYGYQANTGNTGGNYTGNPGNPGNALEAEGLYAVGTSAANYHGSWVDLADHTSGSGNYMIVNGAADTTKNVWASNVNISSAGLYTFTAWISNVCCNQSYNGTNIPPLLSFIDTVNGVTIAPGSFTVASASLGWQQVSSTFSVSGPVSGMVILRNSQNAAGGNDFGLDDISLERTGDVPEPISWAMMVGGFGLMGAAMRRRRVSTTFA